MKAGGEGSPWGDIILFVAGSSAGVAGLKPDPRIAARVPPQAPGGALRDVGGQLQGSSRLTTASAHPCPLRLWRAPDWVRRQSLACRCPAPPTPSGRRHRRLLDVAMMALPCGTAAAPRGRGLSQRSRNTMRWLVLLALSLGGCAKHSRAEIEAENEAALNTFPTDYRSQLLRFLRTSFNDPKFRDASISEPALKPTSGGVSRYVACVRFTDQGGSEAHQHINGKLAIFFRGSVNQLVDADANQCAAVTYKPLVESDQNSRRAPAFAPEIESAWLTLR
jgi:hypothetical protein